MLENSLFVILSAFALFGALVMVWSRQTLYSGFGFMVSLLALAGHFALLHQSFLFMTQVMVSVGAIVVLTLIVIVSVNTHEENLPKERFKPFWMVVATVLVIPIGYLLYKTLTALHQHFGEVSPEYGSLKSVGGELFARWILPFELVSMLLLAAMMAAIVIARKGEPRES